jgi:predicted CopG family antitoxin
MSTSTGERTTVEVKADLHQRLKDLKEYESMSFHDLIREMADVYENQNQR